MTKAPVSGLSRKLYIALAALTIITIIVSIQPSIEVRQLRNLTIPGSFLVGIALLFADKWIRPAVVWTIVGLASGLAAFGNDLASARASRSYAAGDADAGPRASTILVGLVAWPLVLPEVIESIVAGDGES